MRRLTGIAVSPGLVSGRAVLLNQRQHVLRYRIPSGRTEHELERLERSRRASREQLEAIRTRMARRRGPELASLFDAQLLMLDDPMFIPRAAALVRESHVNAEWAFQQVREEFGAVFDEIADPYLAERKGDVSDLVGRLQMNLQQGAGTARDLLREIEDASILVADELTPSLAAQVDWGRVQGFATDAGSRTYHTAILARSLEVPAVVGLHDASRLIEPGQMMVLDGDAGVVFVAPDQETLRRVARHDRDRPLVRPAAPGLPAATVDGVPVRIEANIEFLDDLPTARYAGVEGIGLFRSEFLLTAGTGSIDEHDQYVVYRRMLEGMAPGPVTVRTFDVDADQIDGRSAVEPMGSWGADDERTRRQGLRGLRLSLRRPELFRTQLRALLRAARHGALRIVFPFVSGAEQIREARRLVREVVVELEQGGEVVPQVPIGIMIEIPAAAYAADLLAPEVDFFTIGTNDLIQYCLAVDRADERVARLYEPLHPAILRVILMVRRAATRRRIPVSLCGEMAADPALLPLLIGLGVTAFSMSPGAVRAAKEVVSGTHAADMRGLVRRVLRMATVEEIREELRAAVGGGGPVSVRDVVGKTDSDGLE